MTLSRSTTRERKKLTGSCLICDSKYSSSPYDTSGATFTHMEHSQWEQCIGNVENLLLRGAWALGKRNRTKFQKPRRPLNATSTKTLCRLHYLTEKAQIVRRELFTNTCGIAYANHFHMPTKREAFSQMSPSFIPTTITNLSHCQHIKLV